MARKPSKILSTTEAKVVEIQAQIAAQEKVVKIATKALAKEQKVLDALVGKQVKAQGRVTAKALKDAAKAEAKAPKVSVDVTGDGQFREDVIKTGNLNVEPVASSDLIAAVQDAIQTPAA